MSAKTFQSFSFNFSFARMTAVRLLMCSKFPITLLESISLPLGAPSPVSADILLWVRVIHATN